MVRLTSVIMFARARFNLKIYSSCSPPSHAHMNAQANKATWNRSQRYITQIIGLSELKHLGPGVSFWRLQSKLSRLLFNATGQALIFSWAARGGCSIATKVQGQICLCPWTSSLSVAREYLHHPCFQFTSSDDYSGFTLQDPSHPDA
jgi:hypothetical protein